MGHYFPKSCLFSQAVLTHPLPISVFTCTRRQNLLTLDPSFPQHGLSTRPRPVAWGKGWVLPNLRCEVFAGTLGTCCRQTQSWPQQAAARVRAFSQSLPRDGSWNSLHGAVPAATAGSLPSPTASAIGLLETGRRLAYFFSRLSMYSFFFLLLSWAEI